MSFTYPITRRGDQKENYFGMEIADPYRWLEDDNSAETAAWVAEQNKITFDYLTKIPFRQQIRQRLDELADYPKCSSPQKAGNYYFTYRNTGLQNQSVIYVQQGLDGAAKIFLDPNTLSADGTTRAYLAGFSKDNRLAAVIISEAGSDWIKAKVISIETGEFLSDEINWIKFSRPTWYKDGFFYSRYDQPPAGEEFSIEHSCHQVYYHQIGTEQSADRLIYTDPANPRRYYNASVSEDERFLHLYISSGTSGVEIRYLSLEKGETEFTTLLTGFDYNHNLLDNIGDRFLVLTDLGAANYRLVMIDPLQPEVEKWQEILPECDFLLEWATVFGDTIIAGYLENVHSRVYRFNLQGEKLGEIELPAEGSAYGFCGRRDYQETFYSYESFVTPPTIYHLDLNTFTATVWQKSAVKFDADKYEAYQLFFASKDGTQVPMFVMHKKGLVKNGTNPTLIYGYGGFNASETPSFSYSRLPFLEAGGVYVLVNLRGGGEFGEKWHQAGMLFNKQNVFDDCIAAAEFLISEGYTSKAKLALLGGSNGGLLVGAVINQRPDLFKAAVPAVGVMDMLRYHKFTCGWGWMVEYGNPDEEEHFKNIIKYSPLHNIRTGVEYPAVLVLTADHDDRVVPAHSFKYAAELQAKHTGSNPTLIRVETSSGHGSSNLSKGLDCTADQWAFILYNLQ